MNQEQAWELAKVVRRERMDLRARIKGSASFEDGVELAIELLGEPCVQKMPLEKYLKWIPGLGPYIIRKKLGILGLSTTQKLVGSLTERQAEALRAELAKGRGR